MNGIFGIDISHWQGNFNFDKAKSEGVKFVIIKAGGGDCGLYTDNKFEHNYREAVLRGLKVGAYYFGAAKNVDRAKQEALSFISQIKGKKFDLGVYYDIEGAMLSLPRATLTNIAITFCDTVKAECPTVGIYASSSAFNNKMEDARLTKYIHWVASWNKSKPKLNSGVPTLIWQYGGETNRIRSNKVAGVVCDQDFCYFNIGIDDETGTNMKTNEEIAKEVIDGKWGNGSERKKNLIASGYNYSAIQKLVNSMVSKGSKSDDKTIDEIAMEVIAGKWGNGSARKNAITNAGYNYSKVQARVNELSKK